MQIDTSLKIPVKPFGETYQAAIARARAVKIGGWPSKTNEEIMALSLVAHRTMLYENVVFKDVFREMLYTYGRMYIWPDDLVRATGRMRSNALWPFSISASQFSTFRNAEGWIILADGKSITAPKFIRNGALLTLVGLLDLKAEPASPGLPLFHEPAPAPVAEEPPATTETEAEPGAFPTLAEMEAAFAVLAQILGRQAAKAKDGHR
jgi:hypothetical protein